MNANEYEAFETWEQVRDAVRSETWIFYQAPLDYRSVQVSAVLRKDGTIRVYPPTESADPFNADTGHLSRFRRLAARRTA